MLFAHGSSELSSDYKIILDDFFPRYLNVLYNYKNEIELVRIEGHTSSVYSSAKDENEKYTKNKELSTKRANSVLSYVSSIENDFITQHKNLSRRVDFVIIKKK